MSSLGHQDHFYFGCFSIYSMGTQIYVGTMKKKQIFNFIICFYVPCFCLDKADWKTVLYCGLFSPWPALGDTLCNFLGCCCSWWRLLGSVITPKPSSGSFPFSLKTNFSSKRAFISSSVSHKTKWFNLFHFPHRWHFQPQDHVRIIIFLSWLCKTLWGHLPESCLSTGREENLYC